MRRLVVLAVLAAAAVPAGAAKRVTVAQLLQAVTEASAAHRPEAEVARTIAGMELTERLSEAELDRLTAQLTLGPQVALALELQADRSAFLDLPASAVPAIAPPDQASQLRMFDAAGKYVAETLPRLPNFLATRTTIRYDDSAREGKNGGWPVRAGLHFVDRSSRETSVRAEREHLAAVSGSVEGREDRGMTTFGEFGVVLGMVLSDGSHGKVSWSHWEKSAGGRLAVFHYSVPKSASHFEVVSSIERQADIEGFAIPAGGRRGVSGIGARANDNPAKTTVTRASRSYQGSLWLNPETGTILRITIEADSKESAAFQWAQMLVEYGAVEIGGNTFICPVRSLAFSRTQLSANANINGAASEWLNETLFTNYHRFVGTTRIVTDADAPAPAIPPDGESKPK